MPTAQVQDSIYHTSIINVIKMHTLTYFLFHNQNDVGIFCFVIV
jgi:hypothetical protein